VTRRGNKSLRIGLTFNVRLAGSTARQPALFDSSHAAGQPAAEAAGTPPRDDDEEEFDSPQTIEALAETLEELGHDVDLLGDGEPMLRRLFAGPRPDLVFNFAEGQGSSRTREARVPAALELLKIPYTGSDPLTLAATLDKDCAKRLVSASGVATPAWTLYSGDWDAVREPLARLPLPVIVKPAYEGSSKGILATNLVQSFGDLQPTLERLLQAYRQPILVEEFIDGEELTVGLVGNGPPEVLGIMRVVPRQAAGPFVYSLEVKRDWERLVRYEVPAQLSAADDVAVRTAALAAWNALGCRDVSRVDFRLRDGVAYFLEVNPLPGLSPVYSDLVLLARGIGIEYRELIARIVQAALDRLAMNETAPAKPR
jgi:D-alanine-D-alanine ligase